MIYRKLGQTDLEVSTVGLGCWSFAGGFPWGRQNRADSIGVVHAALDNGVNFFDTAEFYGNGRSEEVLGAALRGRRSKAIVASKVSPENLACDSCPVA